MTKENDNQEENGPEEDYKSKYLYLLAEIDNYRKSQEKELEQHYKSANERLIIDMLKVLDDFESVLKSSNDEKVMTLAKSLKLVLSLYGLEKMEVVGKDYSPELAEAILTEKVDDKSGKIVEELQTGYILNGKIIRYPKVKISI